MKLRPTKAVIAAAGMGTRFLPQTKAMPKEMLPIVDKPIIQYVVEELVQAGIKDIIIVSGYTKRAIEDHFDLPNPELIKNLKDGGKSKEKLLTKIERIAGLANFVYVRQKGLYGSATPLLNVAHLIDKDEPFIYTYADDFIMASPTRFEQMIEVYEKTGGSVLSCIRVKDDAEYDRYGIVAGEEVRPGLIKMSTIVEKPGKEKAPSSLASVSGYLFAPGILKAVEQSAAKHKSEDGEIKAQTAMQDLIDAGKPYYALEIANGRYCDAGNKLEYLKNVVDFALEHEEIGEDFRKFLKTKMC